MDVILGALPNLLPKLGELLVGEYKLQKGMKGEIMFIQAELQSMKGALEKISSTPRDQLDNQDKIWAMDVRELSYDIEDSVDAFMVHGKGSELTGPRGFKVFIDRCYDLLTQFQVRRSIATEIRDIKRRVIEVSERRDRYKIDTATAKPVIIDPRVFVQYKNVTELVGIDEARDEIIKILMEDNEVYRKQDTIVSIVGFGGLGKTTLANMVYEKLRAQFDCTAFISVSQTPDMDKIFKDMLYQLSDRCIAGINVINELREFLKQKR
ncbi:hypothetical protein PR202_gb13439 [Eleusine coracana subsp. coracana]|uniref:Disease resistance protein n=1 Tax=Eleusine coracana subsp. coracana TaxID=191504 RepID=A0AAV5ES38_ELECO|nr:hypothetical protein QOZ80_9BG0714750 [Eleusine coracana subsp. coracana]GJN25593.1 hypothetical protein PR202_gb13439 [Eleusine coracana subsp. coracana]